ncbi:MAG: hypothetical protein ACREBE_14835, partial [bacterium]
MILTVNWALLSPEVVAAVVKLAAVAPAIAAPLRDHWNVIGAVPVAVTVNVAGWPEVTAVLAGCRK